MDALGTFFQSEHLDFEINVCVLYFTLNYMTHLLKFVFVENSTISQLFGETCQKFRTRLIASVPTLC